MSARGAKKHRKADLFVIGGLLLLSLVLYLALNLGREEGAVAVVRIDGREVERHALSVNGTFALNGGSNTLVIENGEAYLSYVRRAAANPLARTVKEADLRHNLDLGRIPEPSERDLERVRTKYLPALRVILDAKKRCN